MIFMKTLWVFLFIMSKNLNKKISVKLIKYISFCLAISAQSQDINFTVQSRWCCWCYETTASGGIRTNWQEHASFNCTSDSFTLANFLPYIFFSLKSYHFWILFINWLKNLWLSLGLSPACTHSSLQPIYQGYLGYSLPQDSALPESAPVSVYYHGGPGEEDLRTPPGHTCSFPAGLPKPPRKKPPTKAYTGNVYTHHSFKMERNSFLPNLQKQTQIKQNEETEEYVLNEEQDKTPGKKS